MDGSGSPPLTRTIPAKRDFSRNARLYNRLWAPSQSSTKPDPSVGSGADRVLPARYLSKSGHVASLLRDVVPPPPNSGTKAASARTSIVSATSPPDSPPKSCPSRFYGPTSPSRHARDFRRRSNPSSANRATPIALKFEAMATQTPSHLIGFPNRGLTCYMNAVLQAVLGVPSVSAALVVAHKEMEKQRRRRDLEDQTVFFSDSLLQPVSRLALLKDQGRQEEVGKVLDELKTNLVKKNRQFVGAQMQDAHEFMVTLFDSLHAELTKLKKRSRTALFQENRLSGGETVIMKHFQFEVKETRKCNCCSSSSSSKVKDYIFKLVPPPPPAPLEDSQTDDLKPIAIEDLLARTMDLQSKFRCTRCAERRKGLGFDDVEESSHEISERFVQLPNILVLYCPRIDYCKASNADVDGGGGGAKIRCRKNRAPVVVSEQIFLSGLSDAAGDGFRPRKRSAPDPEDLPAKAIKFESDEAAGVEPGSQTPEKFKNITGEAIGSLSESEQLAFAIRESLRSHRASSGDSGPDENGNSKSSFAKDCRKGGADSALASLELSSPPGQKEERDGRSFLYRLSAIISHLGSASSTENGHYVTDVYSASKKSWFCYNDSCVSRKEGIDVMKDSARDGYIFIYDKE